MATRRFKSLGVIAVPFQQMSSASRLPRGNLPGGIELLDAYSRTFLQARHTILVPGPQGLIPWPAVWQAACC